MVNTTLLVLAAGIGTRYGGLKQMDTIGPNEETIIDYSIFDAVRSGFNKIVFIIRRDIEKDFRNLIGNKYRDKIEIRYAFQELDVLPNGFDVPKGRIKPWGTAHAILTAKDLIEENFLVINGDDFYGYSAYQTAHSYLSTVQDTNVSTYCMISYELRKTLSDFGAVARGIVQNDANGNLTDVIETFNIEKDQNSAISNNAPLSGDEAVSMNMWGFTLSIFPHLEKLFLDFLDKELQEPRSEFFIPSVVNNLIKTNKAIVKVLSCDATWFGVTYKEDKKHVQDSINHLIEDNQYPSKLW